MTVMLGDSDEIEANVGNYIVEHDPEQLFSTYYDYRFASRSNNY